MAFRDLCLQLLITYSTHSDGPRQRLTTGPARACPVKREPMAQPRPQGGRPLGGPSPPNHGLPRSALVGGVITPSPLAPERRRRLVIEHRLFPSLRRPD